MDHWPWNMENGLWSMDHVPWTLDHVLWTMDHGPWTMDDGPWTMEHGLWTMDLNHGPRTMKVHNPWSLVHAPWLMVLMHMYLCICIYNINNSPGLCPGRVRSSAFLWGRTKKTTAAEIRRALAQSVSDHRPLERDNKKRNFCNCLSFFVSDSIKKLTIFRNWLRNNPFQDKGSEMDSEMSSCSCFLLLRQLFLVQKTAHARGAVREPRAMVIGSCLRKGGHPFFEHLFGALFSIKIVIYAENRF